MPIKRVTLPGTDLGINLVGESAKLSSLSSIVGLFILQNTPKHQNDILSGRFIPSATPTVSGVTRSVFKNEFNAGWLFSLARNLLTDSLILLLGAANLTSGTNVTLAINDLSNL